MSFSLLCYSEKQSSDQRAHKKTKDGGAFRGGRPHRGLSPHVFLSDSWQMSSINSNDAMFPLNIKELYFKYCLFI